MSGLREAELHDALVASRRELRLARERIATLEVERADVDKIVAQRVADALMMRDRAADSMRTSLARAYEVKTEFLAARVAWHLAHGCDTAQRARELALAEWDAGVLGVVK